MKQAHLFEETIALFTPEAVERAAHLLGEAPEKVALAISGIVPFILEAAKQNADSETLAGLTTIYKDDAAFSDPDQLLRSADYFDWLSENEGLITAVFGDKSSDVIDEMSEKSGLHPEATKRLTITAIPAALGIIGRAFRPGAIPGTGLPPYFV